MRFTPESCWIEQPKGQQVVMAARTIRTVLELDVDGPCAVGDGERVLVVTPALYGGEYSSEAKCRRNLA